MLKQFTATPDSNLGLTGTTRYQTHIFLPSTENVGLKIYSRIASCFVYKTCIFRLAGSFHSHPVFCIHPNRGLSLSSSSISSITYQCKPLHLIQYRISILCTRCNCSVHSVFRSSCVYSHNGPNLLNRFTPSFVVRLSVCLVLVTPATRSLPWSYFAQLYYRFDSSACMKRTIDDCSICYIRISSNRRIYSLRSLLAVILDTPVLHSSIFHASQWYCTLFETPTWDVDLLNQLPQAAVWYVWHW